SHGVGGGRGVKAGAGLRGKREVHPPENADSAAPPKHITTPKRQINRDTSGWFRPNWPAISGSASQCVGPKAYTAQTVPAPTQTRTPAPCSPPTALRPAHAAASASGTTNKAQTSD